MPNLRFQIESPDRVLRQAKEYKQSLNKTLTLPMNVNKSMYVQQVADYNVQDVKFGIDRAKYQNQLFRKLERQDEQKRKLLSKSLLEKECKIDQNRKKNVEKDSQKYKSYNKRLNEVQKRYQELGKRKHQSQKQEAIKLRKQIKQFYEQEQQKLTEKNKKQSRVVSCYANALERIQKLQRINEAVSRKTEMELEQSFSRLGQKQQNKFRSSSQDFRKNDEIYQTSQKLFQKKEDQFINRYAQNEASSLKAFAFKQQQNQKTQKRIHQFFKKSTSRWSQLKHRLDQQNAQVPTKCTQKLDRVHQSAFRNTFSSFRDSFSNWRQTSTINRSLIKETDDKHKNQIIERHCDITLRNKGQKAVNLTLSSFKHRAAKVTSRFC